MPKLLRPIPEFADEDAERAFWASHDSTSYIDWDSAEPTVFPNLKPSTRSISLRLPVGMLDDLKRLANKRDVPYQSLLKVILAAGLNEELARERAPERRHPTKPTG